MEFSDETFNIFTETNENIAKYLEIQMKKRLPDDVTAIPDWQYDALKGAFDLVKQKIELNESLDPHFRRQIYFVVNKLFME